MKNNEKYTVGYSVLNPATNSDSDSTKSNGARVVSPSIHTHVDEKGQSGLLSFLVTDLASDGSETTKGNVQ